MSDWFVVGMGVGTVFLGLVCLVILTKILSAVTRIGGENKEEIARAEVSSVVAANAPIENRREIIAAVSAAIAEDLGTDISAIRILSFKKI